MEQVEEKTKGEVSLMTVTEIKWEPYVGEEIITNINNILKNENKNIDNYESLEDYYSEIDNLFMKLYKINFNLMIQQHTE